jgi:hypothetical protein
MKPEYIALFISFGSLVMASLALGWNIYRDVLLRPRVRVSYRVMRVAGGHMDGQDVIIVAGLNKGPGAVKLTMLHYDKTTFWQKMKRKRDQGIIIHDYTNPVSWKLPCRVEVGDETSFIFPICEKTKWAGEILRMGLLDSFGRTHWCPKREALEVQQKYAEAIEAAS